MADQDPPQDAGVPPAAGGPPAGPPGPPAAGPAPVPAGPPADPAFAVTPGKCNAQDHLAPPYFWPCFSGPGTQ